MIRQSLEADSPYVDAVVHGDGLTSLQYRKVQGRPDGGDSVAPQGPGRDPA